METMSSELCEDWEVPHPSLGGYVIVNQYGEMIVDIRLNKRKNNYTYICYREPFRIYREKSRADQRLSELQKLNELSESDMKLSIIPIIGVAERFGINYDYQEFIISFKKK